VKNYDFSTPKAAIESQLQMRLNGDIRAMLEYEQTLDRHEVEEELKTLEVHKQLEYRGNLVVFITFNKEGVKRYEVRWMEKDARSGMWRSAKRGYVGSPVGKTDPDSDNILKQIDEWQRKNQR
jgi:hypothetical protein